MRIIDQVAGALALALTLSTTARADDDCEFRVRGSTLRLQDDCSTDAPLTIPDGMTLDGRGHRITAVDPPGGPFSGAVVQSGGHVAHVRRLIVDTQALADNCSAPLRGILFEGASGSVVHSHVLDIQRQDSGCQGGHAIEVRGGEDGTVAVSIVGNHIEGYQKTGVLAVGDVDVSVNLNRIVGLGATDRIAQNGIQLSAGAVGSVKYNRIEGNLYAPGSFTSVGVLLLSAGDGVEVSLNRIEANDVGIFLSSTSGATVSANRIQDSTYDGITIDGRGAPAEDNHIAHNHVRGGQNGISLFGAQATGNLLEHNHLGGCSAAGVSTQLDADANQITRNVARYCALGISVNSDDNEITGNLVVGSELDGIVVSGSGNVVADNLVF